MDLAAILTATHDHLMVEDVHPRGDGGDGKNVNADILEVCHATNGIRFDAEPVAKRRLRLPARLQ